MKGQLLKLVTSTTPPSPVDDDVVALLRKLLRQAEAGEFNGLAVVTITSPQLGAYTGAGTAYAGSGVTEGVHTALGTVCVLQRRLERELLVFPPSLAP